MRATRLPPEQWQSPGQQPVGAVREREFDVLIVGAGPAGSVAAIHLVEQGHRVLLLDKEHFPREKVCGDGLIADALRSLGKAGLLDSVRHLGRCMRTASVFSPSRIEFPVAGEYITVKRRVLDALIAARAVEAGAAFAEGNVAQITERPGEGVAVQVEGLDELICARYAIIATGAHVKLADTLDAVTRYDPSAAAVRCYVRSGFPLDRPIGSYDRSITPGYGWIFPMRDNEYNVGVILFYRNGKKPRQGLRAALDEFLAEFPLARELMGSGEIISPVKGALLRCGMIGSRPLASDRILLTGETIGTTFPFTGEGIGKAMETAEIAARVLHEALASNRPDAVRDYAAIIERELKGRYLGYELAQKWLRHPRLNDFMSRRVSKSAYLQQALAGIIAETADPRSIFSLRGIWRSLWG